MGPFDIILLGIALSMDAFAVTVSDAVACKDRRRLRALPLAFGLFQGIMPALGFVLGDLFGSVIESYAGLVSFLILVVIGGGMVKDGAAALRDARAEGRSVSAGVSEAGSNAWESGSDDSCAKTGSPLSAASIFTQAVATSIDAFAVGVSLRAVGADILSSSLIIAAATSLVCLAALRIGRRFGIVLGDRAQMAGGLVLVAIGVKALLS